MKNQIAKFFVALSIGIISWQIAGRLSETYKYFVFAGKKTEVPKSLYAETTGYRYPIELEFNKSCAIASGSIAFAAALIVLFVPGLLHKDKVKGEG